MSGWYNRSKRFENLTLSANRLDTAASSLYPTKFASEPKADSLIFGLCCVRGTCIIWRLAWKSHREHDACLLLIFTYFNESAQAKSVYLGSDGGKNATSIALRWINEFRLQRTGSHVREAPRNALGSFSLDGLSALCEHCIKHSQTEVLHRYTFER